MLRRETILKRKVCECMRYVLVMCLVWAGSCRLGQGVWTISFILSSPRSALCGADRLWPLWSAPPSSPAACDVFFIIYFRSPHSSPPKAYNAIAPDPEAKAVRCHGRQLQGR